jgi:hypothetical protein
MTVLRTEITTPHMSPPHSDEPRASCDDALHFGQHVQRFRGDAPPRLRGCSAAARRNQKTGGAVPIKDREQKKRLPNWLFGKLLNV